MTNVVPLRPEKALELFPPPDLRPGETMADRFKRITEKFELSENFNCSVLFSYQNRAALGIAKNERTAKTYSVTFTDKSKFKVPIKPQPRN